MAMKPKIPNNEEFYAQYYYPVLIAVRRLKSPESRVLGVYFLLTGIQDDPFLSRLFQPFTNNKKMLLTLVNKGLKYWCCTPRNKNNLRSWNISQEILYPVEEKVLKQYLKEEEILKVKEFMVIK